MVELQNPGDKAEILKAEREMRENTFPIRSRIRMTCDFFLRAILEKGENGIMHCLRFWGTGSQTSSLYPGRWSSVNVE